MKYYDEAMLEEKDNQKKVESKFRKKYERYKKDFLTITQKVNEYEKKIQIQNN